MSILITSSDQDSEAADPRKLKIVHKVQYNGHRQKRMYLIDLQYTATVYESPIKSYISKYFSRISTISPMASFQRQELIETRKC